MSLPLVDKMHHAQVEKSTCKRSFCFSAPITIKDMSCSDEGGSVESSASRPQLAQVTESEGESACNEPQHLKRRKVFRCDYVTINKIRKRYDDIRVEVEVHGRAVRDRVHLIQEVPYSHTENVDEITPYQMKTNHWKMGIIPENYEKKWDNVEDKEKSHRLKRCLDAMEEELTSLAYDTRSNSWHDAIAAEMEDAEEDYEPVFPGKRETNSSVQGDASSLPLEDYLIFDLQCSLFNGLVNKMHNSDGRRCLESLIQAAAYVCFGENYKADVFITGVTSSYAKHGFPVTNSIEKTGKGSLFSPRSKRGRRSSRSESSEESSCEGRSSNSSSDLSDTGCCSKTLVFPDAVLIHKAKLPVYVLVADVKSGTLKSGHVGQVIMEMIGAGIYQSDVFGIVMSDNEAKIMRLSVNEAEKTIYLSPELVFTFGLQAFKNFTGLLKALIAILDFGSTNISLNNIENQ